MPLTRNGVFHPRDWFTASIATNRNIARLILAKATPGSKAEAEAKDMLTEAAEMEEILNEPAR